MCGRCLDELITEKKKGEKVPKKRKKKSLDTICIAQGRAELGVGSGDYPPGWSLTRHFQHPFSVPRTTCTFNSGIDNRLAHAGDIIMEGAFLPAFRNPRRVAFSIKHQSSGGFALEGNKLEKQTEAKIQLQQFESTVSEYAFVLAELKLLYDQRDRALFTILKYMEQENAKFLRTSTHDVVIPLKRKYLPEKFQSVMGEYLSPEQFGEAFIPEHSETVTVKAKVNGNVVKKWWDMGDEMVEKLMLTLDPAQKREITLKPIKREIGM